MDELALYVLDITMNSVRAGATEIIITIEESDETILLVISDNGCGMTEAQLSRLSDPFFTTRTTRKVGLGIPFLKMLAEMTGGYVKVESVHESVSEEHGTTTTALFYKNHVDFIPVGNMTDTLVTLINGSPEINFTFIHKMPEGEVNFSSEEIRSILGEDISLAEPEVLAWIRGNIEDQYNEVDN